MLPTRFMDKNGFHQLKKGINMACYSTKYVKIKRKAIISD